MSKPTCGALYKEIATWALAHYDGLALFAAGSIAGQAEKVYLGACSACMIRPGDAWQSIAHDLVEYISTRYGLEWWPISYSDTYEIWLCSLQGDVEWMMHDLEFLASMDMQQWTAEQWQDWHTLRARLCGIPDVDIDPQYHLRATYQQGCEPVLPHVE